ncbi:LOW QUALITY PROTEIN: mediator of DNA damage checkpoint protein 1-like, partial [Thrips palmi]|uniref:LOW QUALITY PROTEIN: mediator of DNA damage checkpoint protein 1-like n=1 Tax=Thrips palmi TaxID=161013 RepID=A0A6P8ZR14_THRPL
PANTAAVFDDGDLGLTPPKAPVVQRQIFSARQPSFFPQDFPPATPSHSPFFPAASPSAAPQGLGQGPQGKTLFGAPPQQPAAQSGGQPGANQFLQQIGIPDNLQQFILSPPKQDFPLPNVQQVLLGQQQSGFGQPLLPFSLPHNAPQPPQPPQRPAPPPPPAQLPLQSLNASQPNQKEEVQLLYVPVETLRQRGQLGQHQQRFLQPQQQQLQPQPQASSQFPSQASPNQPPRAQSHVLQYHPQNPNGQFTLSLNHPPNPFQQQQFPQQPFQHQFQHFPPLPQQQPFRQPPQQAFRDQPPQQTFREQPPPPQFQPHHHHFQQFNQFPPQQFQQPQQQSFQQFPSQHRFALPSPSTPAPPANHQFSPTTPAPHQPPLSVYMSPNNLRHDTKITDVLQLLKNARTIPVLDNVSPDSPQVFVGPANLHPPKGYAKFELPYLSSLDTNRVERKVNKLPFFVAPLSFQPPPGYSKILLPPPHIGSVVVNSNVSSSAPQQQATALPQLHEKDVVYTKTTAAPPAVQSTVTFSLPSEITPVNPRLPTLVNSLDEGRTVEQAATTPVSPVPASHTTPRRQPFLRPTTASTAAPATPTPTARSTSRRPLPTRPHPRTTEADPSFQSQRVNLGANANNAGNAKRGRKRLRNQHRLNGVNGVPQVLDDPVRSSTETLNTLSPTTESVLPPRFSPENINLLQDAISFPTERPGFVNSFQQTERPSFSSTSFQQTDRPSSFQQTEGPGSFQQTERPSFQQTERPSFQQTERPSFRQTERPSFSSTPFQQTDRPSFVQSERPSFNSFQTESQPSFTERPSFSPSFTPSSAPVFQEVTTERAVLQPASINGFLQQPQAEDPQSLNQIQQQEFFPTRLENGKVQYQYNLQQAENAETPADPQADFQPTFVRLRGRIQTQQQQPLLPHVPVELQKAVRPARVRVRRPGHRRHPTTTPSAPGADQSHADSKLAFALDNGDVGKDSQYGEKQPAAVPVDESLPTVPALEAHPTFDWAAHSGSALKNGWSAASSGNPQDLPPIQYSVSGVQGEVDAKPSEHSDDPNDYLEPSHGRPSRPASLDTISAQDVDNVMKALEEVGLLDENASASPAPASAPEQDILKEDSHKKAGDPATQKKSGNGRRRGNWVRVRVKRPRDGLATAESQNGASFPGNSVLAAAPGAKDSIVFDKVSPSAPSPSAADVELTAPTTTGVSFADDAVTALGEEQDADATATTPKISSLSIAADVAEDAVKAVEASAEPSAEPSPAEPASTSEPSAPSTLAPVTGSSEDDAADVLRVSTTSATPGSDAQDDVAHCRHHHTTTAGNVKQGELEQELNKFLGSTTSTKVSMETEICFRGRCIKTKADKEKSKKQDQVPVE